MSARILDTAAVGAGLVADLAELGGRLQDLDVVVGVVEAELHRRHVQRPPHQLGRLDPLVEGAVLAVGAGVAVPLGDEEVGVGRHDAADAGALRHAEDGGSAVGLETAPAVAGVPVGDGGGEHALLQHWTEVAAGAELVDDAAVLVDAAPAAGGVEDEEAVPAELGAVRVGGKDVVAAPFALEAALVQEYAVQVGSPPRGAMGASCAAGPRLPLLPEDGEAVLIVPLPVEEDGLP